MLESNSREQGACQGRIGNYFRWVPSMLGKGCTNSGPGSLGDPEMMWTDGPGFSLCTAPLESFGPGFRGVWQRSDE